MADLERGVDDSEESDFSPRKMVIALACLIGSTFVPFVQATTGPFMMLPMIKEFGWTRTDYAFASTFMFVFGSITALVFGRLADRIGVRPILFAGAIFGGARRAGLPELAVAQDRDSLGGNPGGPVAWGRLPAAREGLNPLQFAALFSDL